MDSYPLVSIIIPVHNTASYLSRCVESVRQQTLADIEIILVDNLSKDDSPFLCDEYARKDVRIKVLHLNEAGLSVARNAGIETATAPYIGFLDSDDYVEPIMYEELLRAVRSHGADMAYCNFCFEYENGQVEQVYPNSDQVYVRSARDVQRDIILEKVSSSSCTKLFKRSFFEKHRFPVGMFFEDHATIYRWMDECQKVVWIDRAYYHYLQREDSICHTIDSRKRYHYFLAEYDRLDFVETHALFEGESLYEVRNLIITNCLAHFNESIKGKSVFAYRCFYVTDMRKRIAKWRKYGNGELVPKIHRRIKKIARWGFFYYVTHRS